MAGVKYVFYYYTHNLRTDEMKFVTFAEATTFAPKTHKAMHDLRVLRRKFLRHEGAWRITEIGFAREHEIFSLTYKPLEQKSYDGSNVILVSRGFDHPGTGDLDAESGRSYDPETIASAQSRHREGQTASEILALAASRASV